MASLLHFPDAGAGGYRGLDQIFEFVNDDGEHAYFNCGQAAASTFLLHHGCIDASPPSAELMRVLETAYPPDNFGGWMGTSRRRVMQMCRAHDARLETLHGEEALKEALSRASPVIVMLGVPGTQVFGVSLPAGHWMVAAGFDESRVYLTNWGTMTWDEFRRGWKGLVPGLIQMRETGLVLAGSAASGNGLP